MLLRTLNRSLILAAILFFQFSYDALPARVGIKYNRSKGEYPVQVLKDFARFEGDRIHDVMIALPWSEWEPSEGRLDEELLRTRLSEVLKFSEAHGLRILLSSHCSFWGESGNWTIPDWVRSRPGFKSSTDVLTRPEIREAYISFIKRLVDATRGFPSVIGYNILNEPAVATAWYIENPEGRVDFDARWEGVFSITESVQEHLRETGAVQFLIVGNGGADPGYDNYVWENTGTQDLRPLWTNATGRISAQGVPALIASARWYPKRPRLRTEGVLTYSILTEWKSSGEITAVKTRWQEASDESAVTYDYDAAYDYEGLANAAVPDLEAFYVWRVGSVEGSPEFVGLLDHPRQDRATPYYAALRDLASGVDSFETLGNLPANGKEGLAFDPERAPAKVSRRWSGTGTILGLKDNLPPPDVESRVAARVMLGPGQSVLRSVIAAHWMDHGVSTEDSFTFWALSNSSGSVLLTVRAGTKIVHQRVPLASGGWHRYRISFKELGLSQKDLAAVTEVGFENPTDLNADFFLDEFLIRP